MSTPILKEILRPYQLEDSIRLKDMYRGILGSEMGTGKTEVFLQLCQETQAKHILIVCPKTLIQEWKARIKLRLGEEAAVPKDNGFRLGRSHFEARFLIINYEMLVPPRKNQPNKTNYVDILKIREWDIIGFDEAHRLKNREAWSVIGARRITRNSKRIVLITGTPFLNYPNELWSLLNILYPESYENYRTFTQEYCLTVPTQYGPKIIGIKKEMIPQLRKELEPIMLRREKKEVLKDLPEKSYRDIEVEMSSSQEKVYKQMEQELFAMMEDGIPIYAGSSLALIMRLRQIVLDPGLLNLKAIPTKTNLLMDLISDTVAQDEKIVIFSWFKSYLRRLNQAIDIPHTIIDGEVPSLERANRIQQFQEDDKTKIMLFSITTAIGVTLHRAHIGIFPDRWWVPGINRQAEDRLHRIGQKNNVTILQLVTPKSIDEDILKSLARKDEAFTETIGLKQTMENFMARVREG